MSQQQIAQDLVDRARSEGVNLVGPGGLLTGLTKTVLEDALEVGMSDYLGYDKHEPEGRKGANSCNGTRAKTVLTEVGPVKIDVPRDLDSTFDPVMVRKRQPRLDGIDELALSLTARGLTGPGGSARSAKYTAIMSLWRNAWTEFIPFLDYDVEIRRAICSTGRSRA